MQYFVTRTSYLEEDELPCVGAKLIDSFYLDARLFKTIEEHDKQTGYWSKPWLSEGERHGVTKDGIFRYIPRKRWIIDINSLEELKAFIVLNGTIVLEEDSIEIYDNYRE